MTDTMERAPSTGRVPQRLQAVASDPACPARRHRTNGAWRQAGCRCPEAVAAHAAFVARERVHRGRRNAWKHGDAAYRIGRGWDPRARYEGPRRVGRINLMLLCSGFVDSPTVHERMAAAIRLTGTGNRAGTGLMSAVEIAERIGCSPREVVRYRVKRESLRRQRTARRLADARWRAWRKHGNGW